MMHKPGCMPRQFYIEIADRYVKTKLVRTLIKIKERKNNEIINDAQFQRYAEYKRPKKQV
jgi:hypothetical protein